MPSDLRERAIASAEAEGVSVSEWICKAIAAVLGVDGLERPRVGNPNFVPIAARASIKPKAEKIVEPAAGDALDSALSIFDRP